jgi:hypothetical protein
MRSGSVGRRRAPFIAAAASEHKFSPLCAMMAFFLRRLSLVRYNTTRCDDYT